MLSRTELADTVAAWVKGQKVVAPGSTGGCYDVGLVPIGGYVEEQPRGFAVVTMAEGVVGRFNTPGPYPMEVQSLRIRRADGVQRRMIYCADCGDVRTIGVEELREVGTQSCAKCGALPTGSGCARFHNWGTCPDCRPSLVDHSKSAQVAGRKAEGKRLAEDGQPTKAGPGAPSHGFACEVGPSGVSPLAGGVDHVDVTG